MNHIINDELTIRGPFDYFCLTDVNRWHTVNTLRLLKFLHDEETAEPVMSLRLSTGIIGELDCAAGNAGPKNAQEVIIGLGRKGIDGLLQLGALPCVTCHSGRRLVEMNYKHLLPNLNGNADNADDFNWLTSNYDSRRLDWSGISRLGVTPGRFYTRPNLTPHELVDIASHFQAVPDIGYYNEDVAQKFTSYEEIKIKRQGNEGR